MLSNIKRLPLQLVHLLHRGIDRFWIHPLESQIIPRLETGKKTRLRSVSLRWVSWFANVGRIAVLDLRVNVTRWSGSQWSVTYIGDGTSIEAIRTILFPEPPKVDELPRVFLWQVSALVKNLTGEGDLVVCELNEIIRWSLNGQTTSFVVPRWIDQVLEEIDRPLENILASMNKSMRRNVHRLEQQRFTFSVTQENEDFDFFYQRMYLPHIKSRHEGQGMILDEYESIHNDFMKGGLGLIKDGQDPVCGGIFHLDGDMFVAQHVGVLDGEYDLVKRGANIALSWFELNWARAQGAHQYNFGGSRAQTSDGIFTFKRQWGTRVVPRKGIHTVWSFYTQTLPDNLREYLNALGIITSLNGKCYLLAMIDSEESPVSADYSPELKLAARNGLAGVVVINKKGDRQAIAPPH